VCRALKVLCAAPSADRLSELKRAAVSAAWELVGGASSASEIEEQVERWQPDVVVVDLDLGSGAITAARAARPMVRVVGVGALPGADAVSEGLDDLRVAIAVAPRPGGPVLG
jgi:AmiR/NasT family two-component response regulator